MIPIPAGGWLTRTRRISSENGSAQWRLPREFMMTRDTIIYVSDPTTGDESVLDALEGAGYQGAKTTTATQSIALLFVLHATAAGVLDHRLPASHSFHL